MKPETSRISVMIDREIEDALRERQANMIRKTKRNVSFSHVVNSVLRDGLKSR